MPYGHTLETGTAMIFLHKQGTRKGKTVKALAIFLANSDVASAYETFQRYLGILTAGLACLFIMGRFMPRVNGFGAVCGLVANYIVTFGLDLVPWSGKPHLLLYGLFGMLVCFAVAVAASAISRHNLQDLSASSRRVWHEQ